jgi:energy-coupling factor transporter ATP-binding protein EcfA2
LSNKLVEAFTELFLEAVGHVFGWSLFAPSGKAIGALKNYIWKDETLKTSFEAISNQAEKDLSNIFTETKLPENEILAVQNAVAETLNTSRLSLHTIMDLELDRKGLVEHFIKLGSEYSKSVNQHLYTRLLEHTAYSLFLLIDEMKVRNRVGLAHIQTTVKSIAEILKSERLQSDFRTLEYEQAYFREILRQLNRPDIFGIKNLSEEHKIYSLDAAYISLSVGESLENLMEIHSLLDISPDESIPQQAITNEMAVEKALEKGNRHFITGKAGSGKTTLLKWIAVQAVRKNFQENLQGWNGVPLFVRLRKYSRMQTLPSPEDIVNDMFPSLSAEKPASWATDLLKAGKALLLIDGIDEVPLSRRNDVKEWFEGLCFAFPKAIIVITSRPAAVRDGWFRKEGWFDNEDFTYSTILDMDLPKILMFVDNWHKAIALAIEAEGEAAEELDRLANNLKDELQKVNKRTVRDLAKTPLLCAGICALNRDTGEAIPDDRLTLYRAFIEMFLEWRDKATNINVSGPSYDDLVHLSRKKSERLLRELAYYMVIKEGFAVDRQSAVKCISDCLDNHDDTEAEKCLQFLLERSGILQPLGADWVEFSHNTFAEYLAADKFVKRGEIETLIKKSHNDYWNDIIVFAVGIADIDERSYRDQLLKGIIDTAHKLNTKKMLQQVLNCLQHPDMAPLPIEITDAISQFLPQLVPPNSYEESVNLSFSGNIVVPQLQYKRSWTEQEIGYAAATLCIVGTEESMRVLDGFQAYQPNDDEMLSGVIHPFLKAASESSVFHSRKIANTFSHIAKNQTKLHVTKLPELRNLHLLNGLKNVVLLKLSHLPELKDIGGLKSLSSLKELHLESLPQLQDFSGLEKCPNLTTLYLANLGQIKNLKGLAPLQNLSTLKLQHLVSLSSLDGVEHLKNLKRIEYELPNLKNDSALRGLPPSVIIKRIPEIQELDMISLQESKSS